MQQANESAPVETAAGAAAVMEAPVEEPIVAKKRWYVVHTQSGFENKVQANLEKRIKTLGVGDKVFRILIPTEEVAEMRDGKRKISRRKFFPGYVLVEMEADNENAWFVIRNTPGVTNFVGSDGKPQSLPDDEVRHILRQMGMIGEVEKPKIKPKLELEVGESVRITDGPFRDFVGMVEEANPDRGKVKVMVTIFGRSAPVELDFLQVAKL
ncbi:MAG: transcription termination/antitermination protein NusG [Candidatus Hydrogenedentota bacterium]